MMTQRKTLIEKCKQLSLQQRKEFDQIIFQNIKPYLKKDWIIACYVAMDHEVATKEIIALCKKLGTCVLPKCFPHGRMEFYPIDETTTFTQNGYGIWEPNGTQAINPQSIDVMIVPIVGFDEQLHRLGHGAGYYDRYLPNTTCLKIGIAYELQKVDNISTQSHDVDMDIILSETNIYQ